MRQAVLPAALIAVAMAASPASPKTAHAAPERIPFETVWQKIESHSPSLEAVKREQESAVIARERIGRHWLPYVYLDGRAYSTNDPGIALFSLLSQRQLSQQDFMPDTINHPTPALNEKFTLGAALPLFEGGARIAQTDAAERMKSARTLERKAMEAQLYTESARLYGTLLVLTRKTDHLTDLGATLDGVLSRYQLGAKENPVGYSGLLGLRNLKNRVLGLLAEARARHHAARAALEEMSKALPDGWAPVDAPLTAFVMKHLTQPVEAPVEKTVSYRTQSYEAMAQAARAAVGAERAKFLPQVGLFAEGSVQHGSRATAASSIVGAYLKWDLFVGPNLGAVRQAQAEGAAAEAHADEAKLHERIETRGLREAAAALESNLALLLESARLLQEQTKVSRQLFTGGAINALQLTEIFSRRADLIVNLAEAEAQFLETRAKLAARGNINVPGVNHE